MVMQYSGDIATIQQRLAETSLPAIASAVGSSGRVVGIDISADQIAAARRRCADQPNIETAVH
jgi:hypothetical protein